MATAFSGLVSGIWRSRAGHSAATAAAIPLRQFSFSPGIAASASSRGLHSLFPASNRQQLHCIEERQIGMQCLGLASHLSHTNTYISEAPSHPHLKWLRNIESGRLYHTVSNRNRSHLRFSRTWVVLATANGGLGDGFLEARDFVDQAPHSRGMASSKKKEQPRGSLWKTRSVISKETVQAVHELKRSKSNKAELAKVFQTRIPRLLKMDLLATLSELQRQNEIDLALQVFDIVRKEIWYKPDQFLYRAMMDALGRSRRIHDLEKKFQELQDEGIKPEVPIYRELVGAYVRAHMLPEAMEVHAKMVEVGCGDDMLSLRFIEMGKEKEAVRIKQRRKAAEKLAAEQEEADSTPTSPIELQIGQKEEARVETERALN
ncbi:unnamed protein product [Calypogeia fissa]